MSSADTYDESRFADRVFDMAAAHDWLVGHVLGRRERVHGQLRRVDQVTIADVTVEPLLDLAVADRVAFVLARRTGRTHAVVAAADAYLVVTTDHELEHRDASELQQPPGAPRLISVATAESVTPALAPLLASFAAY